MRRITRKTKNRTKIVFRNKKGRKRGILIISGRMPAMEADRLREGLKRLNEDLQSGIGAIVLGNDVKWQYIPL